MKFSSKFFIISSIAIAVLLITGASVFAAYDTDKEKLKLIKYPVAELGSCKNFNECKTYCNKDENIPKCLRFDIKNLYSEEDAREAERLLNLMDESGLPGKCQNAVECFSYCESAAHVDECWDYAQRHGLNRGLDLETIRRLAKFTREGGKLPGNCEGAECETYCGVISHFAECADFGEKVGLMTKEETDAMRKIARSGITETPGNCKTKESCLKYCDNSANAVVCMEFAQKAGFMKAEDIEAVSRILPYLKSGGKLPGGCTTKESCDAYCGNDTHTNECVDFAVGAGFMSKEDAEIVKKTGGKSPGNCKSKEACDSYCKDEAHIDECVDFAIKAGFISAEEAEMAKRFKITSGPGGCKSRADCEAFCVVNQDTCFQFAKDHGMLSEEDLKNIEQQKDFLKSLDRASPEWLACMEKELGSSFFERFKAHKLTQAEAKSPALEAAQRKCGSEMAQEKQATCLTFSCSEFESCLKALQSSGGDQGGEQQQGEGAPNPAVSAKAQACQKEKINACLGKSCSEFDACVNALQQGGGKQGGQQQQGESDPELKAKIQACTDEKVNACLAKPCSEFQACLNSLGGGGGGGEQQGAPNPAVQAKFMSCQPPKQTGPSSGGGDQGAIECAKQGGSWVGGRLCDFSKQGAGFQTGECAKQGGVWTGTQCDFSQIPQGYSSWGAFCMANYGDS